jgi:hypothetical protein
MVKKIVFGFLFAVLLGVSVYGFYRFRHLKTPAADPLSAIPTNSALILKINDYVAFVEKLRTQSLPYRELMSIEELSFPETVFSVFDSLLSVNNDAAKAIKGSPLIFSLHKSGIEKTEYLFALSIHPYLNEKDADKIFLQIFGNAVLSSDEFRNAQIKKLKSENTTLFYAVQKGVLLVAPSSLLLEKAIKQLEGEGNLLSQKDFSAAFSAANESVEANVFINYNLFLPLIGNRVKDQENSFLFNSNFAGWAALDLTLKSKSLMLNGFSFASKDSKDFLSVFQGQAPQEIEITRVLSAKISNFFYYGFSDFNLFFENYNAFRASEELSSELTNWIGNEAGGGYFRNFETSAQVPFIFIKAADKSKANLALAPDLSAVAEDYNGVEIRQMLNVHMFDFLPVDFSSYGQNLYCAFISDYLFVTPFSENIKFLSDEYGAGRTLEKSFQYQNFLENISSESNFCFISNTAQSLDFLTDYLIEEWSEKVKENSGGVNKFENLAFQFSANDELFYTNFFLSFNPEPKEESPVIWELSLEDDIVKGPDYFKFGLNDQEIILAVDLSNSLYMISRTGRVLWKRNVPEKIISSFHSVVIEGSNYLLFNTASGIYAIDKAGNIALNFPVEIKNKTSLPITLLDYDNNKDYRILVAGDDKIIYNITLDGKPVAGWSFLKTEEEISSAIKHIEISGKDYLITTDVSGKLYVLDRRGEHRIKLDERIPLNKNRSFFIEKGSDLSQTFIISSDLEGKIYKTSLTGKTRSYKPENFSSSHLPVKSLSNPLLPLVVADSNRIFVFDSSLKTRFSESFSSEVISFAPIILRGKVYFRILQLSEEKIFLLDEQGKLINNFPLKGAGEFHLRSFGNAEKLDVLAGAGKNIYLYQLK